MCTRYLKSLNKILAYLFIQVSKFNQLADEINFYDYKPENVLLILEKRQSKSIEINSLMGPRVKLVLHLLVM